MASQKHYKALLNALNGKEVPIETTPQGATYTRPLQITIECMSAKVPMVLIDNGSALNGCPFRTTLTIGLDMETIVRF